MSQKRGVGKRGFGLRETSYQDLPSTRLNPRSLTWRINLSMFFVAVVVLSASILFVAHRQEQRMLESLHEQAVISAGHIGAFVQESMRREGTRNLNDALGTVINNVGIDHIRLTDTRGRSVVFLESAHKHEEEHSVLIPDIPAINDRGQYIRSINDISRVRVPISVGRGQYWLDIIYHFPEARIARNAFIRESIEAFSVAVLIGLAVVWLLLRRTINSLRASAGFISRIDQRAGEQIAYGCKTKEVVVLVDAINHVSLRLARQEQEINSYLKELEVHHYALNAHAIVSIINLKGVITYVNERFCKTMGCEAEEVMGETYDLFRSDAHPDEFFADQWSTVRAGKIWRGEVCNLTQSGKKIWLDTTIVPIQGEHGKMLRFVSMCDDITARIEANRALRESEELLRRSQSFAGIGTWAWVIDSDRVVMSDKLREILSIDQGEEIWSPYELDRFTHPDDVKARQMAIRNCIESSRPFDMEYRIVTDDGVVRWVHATGDVVRNDGALPYLLGVVQDITTRKLSERELERLAAFPEHSPAIVLSVAADGCVNYMNPTASRFFSESEEESRLRHEMLHEDIMPLVTEVLALGEDRAEVELSRGHTTSLWSFYPIKWQNTVHVYGSDISDRRQAEESAQAAQLARASAELASEAKSNFLANMSHEIRTPLTAIIGYSESLLDTGMQMSDRVELIQSINRNGKHLLQIINDILDVSKIEADKLEAEIMPLSPFDLMEDIKALVGLSAEAKHLAFGIGYAFPLPRTIYSDPTRLRQILLNLCGNAVKFTEQGEIRIDVSYASNGNFMIFAVKDTGIGMSKAQQEKVFESFSQADTSTSRRYGGTGLGLHLSRRLANLLGGHVEIESAPSAGSCFRVFIDAGDLGDTTFVNEVPQVQPVATVSSPLGSGERLHGRVLLVEDNPDNQRLIKMNIERVGPEVEIAENGQQAVEKTEGQEYGLVLMDMQMPIMGGPEATKIMRDRGYAGPIVTLTANATPEDMAICIEAGSDDFLTKPIDRERLVRTLGLYLPKSVATTQAEEGSGAIYSTLIDEGPEFAELVVDFVDHLPGMVDSIRDSTSAGQWDILRKHAHDLKGVGGGYGYPQLTEIAGRIGFQVAKEDYSEVNESVAELVRLSQRIIDGVVKQASVA